MLSYLTYDSINHKIQHLLSQEIIATKILFWSILQD